MATTKTGKSLKAIGNGDLMELVWAGKLPAPVLDAMRRYESVHREARFDSSILSPAALVTFADAERDHLTIANMISDFTIGQASLGMSGSSSSSVSNATTDTIHANGMAITKTDTTIHRKSVSAVPVSEYSPPVGKTATITTIHRGQTEGQRGGAILTQMHRDRNGEEFNTQCTTGRLHAPEQRRALLPTIAEEPVAHGDGTAQMAWAMRESAQQLEQQQQLELQQLELLGRPLEQRQHEQFAFGQRRALLQVEEPMVRGDETTQLAWAMRESAQQFEQQQREQFAFGNRYEQPGKKTARAKSVTRGDCSGAEVAKPSTRTAKRPSIRREKKGLFLPLCRFHLRKSCTKGKNCDYSHDPRSSAQCKDWTARGKCDYGEVCRFTHGAAITTVADANCSGTSLTGKDTQILDTFTPEQPSTFLDIYRAAHGESSLDASAATKKWILWNKQRKAKE